MLGESLSRFLTEFGEVIANAPEGVGPFVMDEMELSLSIAATGDFRIASSSRYMARRPLLCALPRCPLAGLARNVPVAIVSQLGTDAQQLGDLAP